MTTNDAFERNLSVWLHEDAEHHVPDHLEEVLQRTATARQRPAWSSLERWLPVDTTFRPPLVRLPRPGQLLLVAGLIIVLVALAIIAAGSQRRLPEPFGLARNGAIVTSRDGEIYLLDGPTAEARLAIGGDGFDFSPIFSRDGTRMLFVRSDGALPNSGPVVLTMYVANADGSQPRAVTPPTTSLDWFDWSPNGARIAYMAHGVLWIVDVDGGGAPSRIEGTGPVHFPTWLPPGGKEIVYRRETENPGIWAVAADGATPPRELSKAPANNRFDYQSLTVAPDGSRVSFARFTSNGTPSVVILDLRSGEEMVLPHPSATSQRGGAVFSPDASLVAYPRIYYADNTFQLVVAPADGSSEGTVLGPRQPGEPEATFAFTPDGSAVISMYGSDDTRDIWRFPIDGSPGSVVAEGGMFSFADQQRLAP